MPAGESMSRESTPPVNKVEAEPAKPKRKSTWDAVAEFFGVGGSDDHEQEAIEPSTSFARPQSTPSRNPRDEDRSQSRADDLLAKESSVGKPPSDDLESLLQGFRESPASETPEPETPSTPSRGRSSSESRSSQSGSSRTSSPRSERPRSEPQRSNFESGSSKKSSMFGDDDSDTREESVRPGTEFGREDGRARSGHAARSSRPARSEAPLDSPEESDPERRGPRRRSRRAASEPEQTATHAGESENFGEGARGRGTAPADDRYNRTERPVRAERSDRPSREESNGRGDRPARAEPESREDKISRDERPSTDERISRDDRPSRSDRPERTGRGDRSPRGQQISRDESTDRSRSAARPVWNDAEEELEETTAADGFGGELALEKDDNIDEHGEPTRRRRRRRRVRGGSVEEEGTVAETGRQIYGRHSEEEAEDMAGNEGSKNLSVVPWLEAITTIVDKNIENHSRTPGYRGRGGGRNSERRR